MKIPKRYEDLTLDQYIKLENLDSKTYDPDPLIDAMDRAVDKLSILTGKPKSEIESMHRNKILTMLANAAFTNTPPESVGFKKHLWFGLKRYKAVLSLPDMCPAQMIDFINLSKAGAPINELLAIMYVRGSYRPEKHAVLSKSLLNVKIGHCLGLFFFYSACLKKCEPIIAKFLEATTNDLTGIMNEILTDKEFIASLSTGAGNTM